MTGDSDWRCFEQNVLLGFGDAVHPVRIVLPLLQKLSYSAKLGSTNFPVYLHTAIWHHHGSQKCLSVQWFENYNSQELLPQASHYLIWIHAKFLTERWIQKIHKERTPSGKWTFQIARIYTHFRAFLALKHNRVPRPALMMGSGWLVCTAIATVAYEVNCAILVSSVNSLCLLPLNIFSERFALSTFFVLLHHQ